MAEEAIKDEFEIAAKENDSMAQQFLIERLKEIMFISIKYMLEQMKTQSPIIKVYHEFPFDDYILDETNNSRLRGRIDQVELIKPFEDKTKYKIEEGANGISLNDDNSDLLQRTNNVKNLEVINKIFNKLEENDQITSSDKLKYKNALAYIFGQNIILCDGLNMPKLYTTQENAIKK